MTDTLHTPPPTATAPLRPFAHDPIRWEAERDRALHTGHLPYDDAGASTTAGEPCLVHERTEWGWLAWTVPADGSLPELPYRIGILPPAATWRDRLAARWLTRRPARRIGLAASIPGSLRYTAALLALVGCAAALHAIGHGVPAGIALPLALLPPLLAEHLPDRLDVRAQQHVRILQGPSAAPYVQRLAAAHTYVLQAAAGRDRYELRRAAEIGQHVLWDAAGLLQTQDTRAASIQLIDRERLMLQLAAQVAQIIKPRRPEAGSPGSEHRRPTSARSATPHRPCADPYMQPTTRNPLDASPPKERDPMPEPHPTRPAQTEGVYLLFAPEPYYPCGTQEINTTVVAAASLLHPLVRQPDGAQIHDRLTCGRRPGEIVPLATLTHELDGGIGWPKVGDWEQVTADLLRLVRTGGCDALSLGLPEIARTLVCNGPDSEVRAIDPMAERFTAYGPADRAAVLVHVGEYLAGAAAPALWPGDGLLEPLGQHA